MRENIITGQWLDSDHMRLAQQILQNEHPLLDGFQSTLLSQNDGFCPVKGESVQIHHIDNNHWVTVGGSPTLHCRQQPTRQQQQREGLTG